MSFHSYSGLHLGSPSEDKMHHTHESTFPFFGENISALSYISWEREIDEFVHSFHLRHSKYYFLTLCISSFVGHAREWWDYRQSRVEKRRKSPIQNWSKLRACMRRTFIPPSFDLDREIEKKKMEIARRKEEKLTILVREMRELEEKERLRIQRKEQKEREKFEQELREEEEQLRKEKEEIERKEFEEKERVRQEKEFKRKEKDIERKERKEIMLKEVEIQHHTTTCIDFKGLIPSFNSSLVVINAFVLVLPKNVFPPLSFILNTSKEFPKIMFDFELPFRYQLSLSDKQYFCEVGYIPNPSKIKSPSSYIPYKYVLLPFRKVIEKLFDYCGIHIFDPRGIQFQLLWALKKSLNLRTNLFQEGGGDEYHP